MKSSFLPGCANWYANREPQVGELLPHVARHFVEKRILTVHDFVVREGKYEIFGERVKQREGELILLVAPENRILGEIPERVVHPAHVPFQAEAETAKIRRTGDAGPCGGFFGDRQNAGESLVRDFVQSLEKLDRVRDFRGRRYLLGIHSPALRE